MKIVKLPIGIDTRFECECGCEFEWDVDDLQIETIYSHDNMRNYYSVRCPFCKTSYIVHKTESQPSNL